MARVIVNLHKKATAADLAMPGLRAEWGRIKAEFTDVIKLAAPTNMTSKNGTSRLVAVDCELDHNVGQELYTKVLKRLGYKIEWDSRETCHYASNKTLMTQVYIMPGQGMFILSVW